MTTPVESATNAPTQQQTTDPKFDRALADAGEGKEFTPSPDQLAQMGVAVMSPILMSRVQEIIGEALSGEE